MSFPHCVLTPFRAIGSLTIASSVILASTAAAQSPRHPLDPLSWEEMWTVRQMLVEAGRADGDSQFWMVNLHEPPKSFVTSWSPGEAIPRSAFVIIRNGPQLSEAVVDLVRREVMSWEDVEDIMLPLGDQESDSLVAVTRAHPEFEPALARRGFEDPSSVRCRAQLLSFLRLPAQLEGRRVALVSCGRLVPQPRYFPSPAEGIEGLGVLVDADSFEVIRVIDERVGPDRIEADYESAIERPRDIPTPIDLAQPLGPSFTVDGQLVSWQNWTFHFRVDPRVGLVVSTVRYRDGEQERSILYRGSLGEIFVPYMDPSTPLFNYNWFDLVYGGLDGVFSDPLEPGVDCPDNAMYFDAVVASGERGTPRTIARSACLFEAYSGEIAWRHRYYGDSRPLQTRAKRDLVLRSIALLGNYDYVFDWVFQQNGSIVVRVGSTGVIEAKKVAETAATLGDGPGGASDRRRDDGLDSTATTGARPDAYGRFVSPNLVAVNHDHFFNYRLDLDVDGPENRFLRDRLVRRRLPEGSLRTSVWQLEPDVPATEAVARARIDPERPSLWRVVHPERRNGVGYPVSYQITPRTNPIVPLVDMEDAPWRRAAFTDYHIWVTPYRTDELYAAGMYPEFAREPAGLGAWTEQDRRILDEDIVVWYTLGMHHVPRGEDWPVMPTVWGSFELRPFDFFDRNPALDLPRPN